MRKVPFPKKTSPPACAKGVLNASLVPVVVGSSLENKGGRELLDAIARLFPSPLERPAFLDADGNERASSDEGPACGFVFKTIADPFSGQLNMVRVISGTISSESTLKNMRTEESERLGTSLYLDGKTQTPCKDVLGPGAIIAVGKLKNTRHGRHAQRRQGPLRGRHAAARPAAHHFRPRAEGKGRRRQGVRRRPEAAG